MTARAAVRHTFEVLSEADKHEPLTREEQHRRSALVRQIDRDDFLAARLLARRLLVDAGLREPLFQQICAECGGPHGRPVVVGEPGVHVSWAHGKGMVAAVVDDHRVGIDVERTGRGRPPFPAATVEVSDWLRWTRMEALVKRGDGDLDFAMRWPLAGEAAPDGLLVAALLPGHSGVLTDFVDRSGDWVASVAAAGVAHYLPTPAWRAAR